MLEANSIVKLYQHFEKDSTLNVLYFGTKVFPFPKFQQSEISNLIKKVKYHFEKQDSLLYIYGSFHIIGDIHGNILDLFRLISSLGYPPEKKYLFLGDYVDRGEYSVEVLTFLFSFMLVFPKCVYLLRGNHEFSSINKQNGFYQEIFDTYKSDQLYNEFNIAFNSLPLAAVINDCFFCVHGGLGPGLTSLSQISQIKKTISEIVSNSIICSLMWSDPIDQNIDFIPSPRGCGFLFGPKITQTFLEKNNLTMLIRGHEFVQFGINSFAKGLGITVFSSSNYKNSYYNSCGVVTINNKCEISAYYLPPGNILFRKYATFKEYNIDTISLSNCYFPNLYFPYSLYSIKLFKPKIKSKNVNMVPFLPFNLHYYYNLTK
jgi:protein phosphatase